MKLTGVHFLNLYSMSVQSGSIACCTDLEARFNTRTVTRARLSWDMRTSFEPERTFFESVQYERAR